MLALWWLLERSMFEERKNSVRLTGLEPARRETLDPKSSASTNSATGAFYGRIGKNQFPKEGLMPICGCKGTKKSEKWKVKREKLFSVDDFSCFFQDVVHVFRPRFIA